MDNSKEVDDVKLTVRKSIKTKSKNSISKKGKKGKKKKGQLNKTNNLESEKKIENKNDNENIKIIEQKEVKKKEKNNNKEINIKKINKDNPIFNELKLKIKEKDEKIKELALSQEKNKKILIELLKKVSTTIESNAEALYSKQNDMSDEKLKHLQKLNELLEKKKIESNKVNDMNKKFKNKYENIMKDINTPTVVKLDVIHKRINALKENNSILSQEIKTIKHQNNLDKIFSLNPKYKILDVKMYSDEYISLTNEKFKLFSVLKNSKKLIKDTILQFQNLIKIINEKKIKIKNPDLDKELINLKEDLTGDEESIYNRIITNKTIININDNYMNKKMRNIDSAKQIDLLASRAKKLILKDKNMIKSRSSINMTNFTKNENDHKDVNQINIKKKDMNLNDYNCDNMDYKTISNFDFEKILIKKQKYLNFTEKLDKSINDTSIFYENKIKEINNLLEMNSKRLSNIQQENELLKSEIADMRRILELNKKEIKIKNRSNFDENFEKAIKKLEMYKNENSSEIEENTSKNIEKDSYIEMIKKKYKLKNKSKIILMQKEALPNHRSYY